MGYYIVSYRVMVDGKDHGGRFGQVESEPGPKIEGAKTKVENGYRKLYPKAAFIDVVLIKMNEVTEREYLAFDNMYMMRFK